MDLIDIPQRSLLKLVMAGALGSMLGTLLLESIRGKKPVLGWTVLASLVLAYSYFGHHPLTTKKLRQVAAAKAAAL